MLRNYGFVVLTAENAKNALEIFENEKVDLMITDIIMPEMDGYQLSAIVKEKYPDIKIQLISGFADNQNMSLVDQSLHNNLLYKPFEFKELLQRISKLLDK